MKYASRPDLIAHYVNFRRDPLEVTLRTEDSDEAKYVYGFVELGEEIGEEVDDDTIKLDVKEIASVESEESSTSSPPTAKPSKTFVCEEEGCGKKYSAHHHLKVARNIFCLPT